jgi:hypothetical protein
LNCANFKPSNFAWASEPKDDAREIPKNLEPNDESVLGKAYFPKLEWGQQNRVDRWLTENAIAAKSSPAGRSPN